VSKKCISNNTISTINISNDTKNNEKDNTLLNKSSEKIYE